MRLQHWQDFDKIQLSKIIEKVFIYGTRSYGDKLEDGDIFYKEEKSIKRNKIVRRSITG